MGGAPLREVAALCRRENPPEGWTIKSGKAAAWGQQPGGATQLQIVDQNGEAVPVSRLIKEHILKGKESPIGFS